MRNRRICGKSWTSALGAREFLRFYGASQSPRALEGAFPRQFAGSWRRSRAACLQRIALFPLLVVFSGLSLSLHASDGLSVTGRIDLIRAFVGQIAVAKVGFPVGKRGVYINARGQLDQQEVQTELRDHGEAVAPGVPVEITKIVFKPHSIIFVINGGRQHGKWYQHIQIGVGSTTQPIAPAQPSNRAQGSYATLRWPGGTPSSLTSVEAKRLLAAALDFNRVMPTVLYSPDLPKNFKKAIKNHKVLVGMNRSAVISAKGVPDQRVRSIGKDGEVTKVNWIYGQPPHILFVTFRDGRVVEVRQY